VSLPASVKQIHLRAGRAENFDVGRHVHFTAPCRELWIYKGRMINLPAKLLIEKAKLFVEPEEVPILNGFPALQEFRVKDSFQVKVKHAPALERIYGGASVWDVTQQPDGPPTFQLNRDP